MNATHQPCYCPTARDVDCCPEHRHPTPCCDRPELHTPLDAPADGGCLFAEAVERIKDGAIQRRSTHPRPDDPDRIRARIEALRAS